jgi:hypothetical protein
MIFLIYLEIAEYEQYPLTPLPEHLGGEHEEYSLAPLPEQLGGHEGYSLAPLPQQLGGHEEYQLVPLPEQLGRWYEPDEAADHPAGGSLKGWGKY